MASGIVWPSGKGGKSEQKHRVRTRRRCSLRDDNFVLLEEEKSPFEKERNEGTDEASSPPMLKDATVPFPSLPFVAATAKPAAQTLEVGNEQHAST